MLKITVDQVPRGIILKLEGSLAGAWVAELEHAWRSALLIQPGQPLFLDVVDIDAVDAAGRYLLLLMCDRGAHLIGAGARIADDLIGIVDGWRLHQDS